MHGVHSVFLAGKSPKVQSYTVCMYGSGQFYTYPLVQSGQSKQGNLITSITTKLAKETPPHLSRHVEAHSVCSIHHHIVC